MHGCHYVVGGGLRQKTALGRSFHDNRSERQDRVAGEKSSYKTADAAACASGRAIGDNSSTMEETEIELLALRRTESIDP